MTRRSVARTIVLTVVALLTPWLLVAPADAAARTAPYILPAANPFPESIAVVGDHFFVGSVSTGTVSRGDLDRRRAQVWSPGGTDGRTSVTGVKATDDRLILMGGATGKVFVYNVKNGRLIREFDAPACASGHFINDAAVAKNGDVYVTDSFCPVLFRIPAAMLRTAGPAVTLRRFLSFRGTVFQFLPGGAFNANGIVAAEGGRVLVIVQSATGFLFRVNPSTRRVSKVDTGGADLTNGDGMALLGGDRLVVVRNANAEIATLQLRDDATRARLRSRLVDPEHLLFPTGAAEARGRLLVTNSQLDKMGGTPVLPFTVASLPLH